MYPKKPGVQPCSGRPRQVRHPVSLKLLVSLHHQMLVSQYDINPE
jgi:hypothetical protein